MSFEVKVFSISLKDIIKSTAIGERHDLAEKQSNNGNNGTNVKNETVFSANNASGNQSSSNKVCRSLVLCSKMFNFERSFEHPEGFLLNPFSNFSAVSQISYNSFKVSSIFFVFSLFGPFNPFHFQFSFHFNIKLT